MPVDRAHPRDIGAWRKILFSLILSAAMLIAMEGAVRVRAWVRYGSAGAAVVDSMLVPDQTTGLLKPKPGYTQHSERISIKINSLGFRGDEISVAKPPRTFRIATVGASTTFCGEVSSDRATWPSQLQEILQRAHPDLAIQVINAGVPGYTASESLRNLEARVLPLHPDLVIYYEANNDLAYDTRELARQRGLTTAVDSPVLKEMARYSLLYDLVQKNLKILWASRAATAKLTDLPPDLPHRYIGELDKMHRLLTERGVKMVTSTFFVKYRRGQPRETQITNASIAFYYMPWMTIDTLLEGMDLYNTAIVEYATSHGVPVVNDRESIPADDAHFADWAHFADSGAAMMGQRFAGFLEEQRLVGPVQ